MYRNICYWFGACLALTGQTAIAAGNAATAYNPRISLILNTGYADYSSDAPADVTGVLLAEETEPAEPGFSLAETELVLEANVDDQWHAWATVALHEGEAELEEAYADTMALPGGLGVKLGRFKSDLGYQNRTHAHAWPFVDAPLVYRALLGNGLQDDGVQFRWLAPSDLFVEMGVEALRGGAFPSGGEERSGFNSYVGFLHLGGDVGSGGSWRLGLSQLEAGADGRATGEEPDDALFTGDSRLSVIDVVYKWAPNGNATNTNVVFNAEYFRRSEDGDIVFDPNGSAVSGTYEGTQSGYYAQLIYQFMPRWRVGLRHDALHAENTLGNPAPGNGSSDLLEDNADDATRQSVMLDFSNSEFSRIRLQYNRDDSRPGGEADNQYFVQFIYSLGAHPAHQF